MTDIVSPRVRSRMMSGIKGSNTKPEILIRKALFASGFRYRLHVRKLPGKPDLVLTKHNAVIFVNGCFWHLHRCHLFKWPSTRREFWREKLEGNAARDKNNRLLLLNSGWRVLDIWECALKGKTKRPFEQVLNETVNWLNSDQHYLSIEGEQTNDQGISD